MSEGVTNNPLFPIADSTLRVTLPVGLDPVTGQPIRGVEGLRPATVIFPRVVVTRGGDDTPIEQAWQPIAAVAVAQCVAPTSPGDGAIITDALDRVSFWLMGVVYDMPGQRPDIPPLVQFQIRAAIAGAAATTMCFGEITLGGWDNSGLIAQVSGLLCSQWELWMKIRNVEDPGTQMKVRIGATVDRIGGTSSIGFEGGSSIGFEYGTIVSSHTP